MEKVTYKCISNGWQSQYIAQLLAVSFTEKKKKQKSSAFSPF
jgi:hypothetical protein